MVRKTLEMPLCYSRKIIRPGRYCIDFKAAVGAFSNPTKSRNALLTRWGESTPFNRISIKFVSVDAVQQCICFRVTEETDAGGYETLTAHLRNGLGSRRTAGNCVLIPTPG